MSTRDLPYGLTANSFTIVEPVAATDGLARFLKRLVLGQVAASVALGACLAYANGSPGPKPYSEQVAFSLRLVKLSD